MDRISHVFWFLASIGHKFDEQVPQERQCRIDSNDYQVRQLNQVEANFHQLRNMLNETYGVSKDVTTELEEMGIIDLKVFEDRETNFFVHYNWLHFLTQIVLFLQKSTDVSQLVTLITKFETWAKKPAAASMTIRVMQQDQYMQSPVTLSIFYEPLLKVLLERLDVSELHFTV